MLINNTQINCLLKINLSFDIDRCSLTYVFPTFHKTISCQNKHMHSMQINNMAHFESTDLWHLGVSLWSSNNGDARWSLGYIVSRCAGLCSLWVPSINLFTTSNARSCSPVPVFFLLGASTPINQEGDLQSSFSVLIPAAWLISPESQGDSYAALTEACQAPLVTGLDRNG